MTIRRRNTTRKGPVAKKRSSKSIHPYESVEPTVASLNGQRVEPLEVDSLIQKYDNNGWIDTHLGDTPCSYKVIMVPAEKMVTWAMNQRRAEDHVNQMVETGEKPQLPKHKKAELIRAIKEESVQLVTQQAQQPLITGMLDNLGPLDPCDVIARKDGYFDVIEGNRRTAVTHFLTGFLGDDERLNSLPKKFRKDIGTKLLHTDYPGVVPVRVWRGVGRPELRRLLEIHHVGGKFQWTPFVQGKSMFEDFEAATHTWILSGPDDLKKLRNSLNDKRNIDTLKSIASRCQLANYTRIRYRIMAFAALVIFKVRYNQPSGLRAKFDTFRRFYDHGGLRALCEGKELSLTKADEACGTAVTYKNKRFEADFINWVAEGRIHDTVQVTELPSILAYDDIREDLFLKGDPTQPDFFKKCTDAVDKKRNGATKRLKDNLDDIYEIINTASRANVGEIAELTENSNRLFKLKDRLDVLCGRVEDKVEEEA